MIRKTSIATYFAIKNSGVLSDKRMKVYDIFYEHPDGLTGTQVSRIFKSKYPTAENSETVRNRITELVSMGVLNEIATVECEYTKRKVLKFALNDNMPTSLPKKTTLNDNLDSILENIVIFSKMLTNEQKVELRKIYKQIEIIKK
jgi:Fe2+ or Zn2+ uptake regulation protein